MTRPTEQFSAGLRRLHGAPYLVSPHKPVQQGCRCGLQLAHPGDCEPRSDEIQ